MPGNQPHKDAVKSARSRIVQNLFVRMMAGQNVCDWDQETLGMNLPHIRSSIGVVLLAASVAAVAGSYRPTGLGHAGNWNSANQPLIV
jgi:hypothetical protein